MSYIQDERFLTPEQIARKRKAAQAMMAPNFSPVQSPMEGFARLAQAGVGAWKERQLNDQMSNNGMTDGAARRGIFGNFGQGGQLSQDTPFKALGRSIFGGPLGEEPTGLRAPNYPAPPPQNDQAMMQAAPALGQPSFPAAPTGPVPTGPAPSGAMPGGQSIVPPGVTPMAGDNDIQGKPVTDLNGVTSGATGIPSIRDSIANALNFFRSPV